MVGNGIKYDIMLDAMVWGVPGFENNWYKIPVKVSVVEFLEKNKSNPDLEKRLRGINTLYYKQTTAILKGDRIRAYGNEKQLIEEAKPQRIELLDKIGNMKAYYNRQD